MVHPNTAPQDNGTVEELTWWLDLLAEADRLHRQLPARMILDIEESAGPHEVMRLAILWSSVSCSARQRIQAAIEESITALRLADELTPHDGAVQLRLIESSGA